MAMGLQELMMFRDNLQQPAPTGMDNLRNLQALTLQGMAAEDYINQPMMMDTGLMSLPVAQAGFGGFIKSITRIPRAIAKTVKRVAKSPLGRAAITLAPAFVGLPPVFANPALNAAFFSGTTSLLTGAKPRDALKSAVLSGGLTGLTQGFTTPKPGVTSSMVTGADPSMANYTGNVPLSSLKAPPAETNIFKDLLRGATDKTYDPEGTVLSRLGQRLSGAGQFEGAGLGEQLGFQPGTAEVQAQESLQKFDDPKFNLMSAVKEQQSKKETPSLLSKAGDFLKTGKGKLAAGAGIVGGLALLGDEEIPQDQLDMAGLTKETRDTDFDKQKFVYRDAEGNPLTTVQALQMIQAASQGFGEGGQRMASGVRGAFERVDDPVLSASGGLIGMAYGGSMPMNNMDVKYKEFSGMVGGRGDGMEDNVYMPIVEGESGQQVATLAVSPKEYVVDANTMSLLGNGNPDEGAEIMDKTVKDIRMAATGQKKQQKEIDGLAALNRMRRSV